MSDGHYHSVPSAEACQQDCQVDPDEDLNHDADGSVGDDADDHNSGAASQQDCQVDFVGNDGENWDGIGILVNHQCIVDHYN